MKASACFHQGILASAMIVSLAFVSPMSYGQSFVQTPRQQYETNSPQHWLGQARQMMAQRRFEVAQQYIELAESILQNQPNANLPYTPAMARQELRALVSPETAQVIPTQPAPAPVVAATHVVAAAPAPAPPTQLDLQTASSALLAARQALAVGDVETAAAKITTARSVVKDFSRLGDSPETIQQLLQRQDQLADMRAQADPDYNRQAAAFLLTQAKTLIKYRDVQTSRMLVEQAQQFQVSFTPEMGDPKQLLEEINSIAGVSPESVSKTEDQKKALSLISQAQLAIDQKRWSDASGLVNQAKAIGLADSDYDDDQIRPWQLELEIQNGQKSAVVQSVATDEGSDTKFDPNVATADFVPSRDTTKNVTVAAALPVEATLTDEVKAMTLYESGVSALNSNDRVRAGEFFRLALQRQQELTPDAMQVIQNFNSPTTIRDDNVKPAQAQSKTIDLNQIRSEQQAAFRKLQSSIYKERADAEKLLEKSPNQALAKLTAVRERIASANLTPETQRPLLTLIERDITEIQAYIEENLSEILNDEANEAARDLVERRAQRRVDTDEQIAKLVNEYNTLIDERRFDEAGRIVRQAVELAPDLEVVAVMEEKYRAERNFLIASDLKAQRERGFIDAVHSVERSSIPFSDELNPLQFPPSDDWTEKSNTRLRRLENARYSSDSERNIWNTLRQTEVEGEYVGTLAEAMGQLSRQAAVNIVFDNVALEDANIQTDQLINVPLTNPVKLENALNIILGNARLTFSVENEVIKVTTPESKRGKTKAETYYIGDLVMPMQVRRNPLDMMWNNNPYSRQGFGGQGSGNRAGGVLNVNGANPTTIPPAGSTNTLALAQQLGGGIPLGGNGIGQTSFGGSPAYGNPAYGSVGGGGQLGGISEADFTPLIELIQSTIQSDSWEDSGTGEGTIQAYPANLSLVVNNTQEVQDQIVDLLKKLRELNDVQIVIEVRFITLTDNFFERVGIDFDFSLNDNAPVNVNGLEDVQSESIVIGRGINDAPTGNLDLQFLQSGFNAAVPAVGGFDLATAANFGFAILSDIEVFFLIQASKGSSRSNVTNSPTVTMFNGQSATVTDGFQQPFVTSVTPVVGDFAVAHQPIITILPDGTNLNVAAVVSNDRRSVRMTLVPQFTQIGDVQTFTFEGSTSTATSSNTFLDDLLNLNDGGIDDQAVETTQTGVTVQLPIIATTSVSTVVSVPDGGTILLGGVKRSTESRDEQGLPFLSNIPYVNRLFKNVGIGRTTTNLMMMVTPRIIIQAEEEAKQIGDTLSN